MTGGSNNELTADFCHYYYLIFLYFCTSKFLKKISKWWVITKLLFISIKDKKSGSGSKSKDGGVYMKIKRNIQKIARSFRSRLWITIMKPSNNLNNQYQGWEESTSVDR